MSTDSIPKQATGVYPEPAAPQLLDANDPDAEGLEIDDELHSFTCPCRPCKAFNDRLDRLLKRYMVMETEE